MLGALITLIKETVSSGVYKEVYKTLQSRTEVKQVKVKDDKFLLKNVKYDSQRDNKIDPFKTCYPTSLAMVLRTLEQKEYGGLERHQFTREDSEDILIKDLVDNHKEYQTKTYDLIRQPWALNTLPRYVAAFWVWYINTKCQGYHAGFKVMSQFDLREFMRIAKVPVTIGTYLTHGGHVVVATGFDDKGFYCNDPYGDARDYGKFQSPKYGEMVYYKNEMLPEKINCTIVMHKENI